MFIHPSLQVILICAGVVLSIAAYGTYRCKSANFKDPLTTTFLPAPWDKFADGWGVTHLLFFLILTYFYTEQWILIFFLGVLWEIIESFFHDHPFYISKCNYVLDTDQVAGWWYGRWQDIVMNSIGMSISFILHMIFS